MTADSTPSTVSPEMTATCRKCNGRTLGDFGLKVKGGKCLACDGGRVFTPSAFAQVTALRLERQMESVVVRGLQLSAADPAATFQAREGYAPPTPAALADEITRTQAELESLRGRFKALRRQVASARSVAGATTLSQVRIAIWGENDTYHTAK